MSIAVASDRPLWRDPVPMICLALLGTMVLAALLTPAIERLLGVDAVTVDLFGRFQPPSEKHLLGQDELGRDMLARLLRGGQVSLLVGFLGAGLAAVIGTVIGLLAGYLGGRLDAVLMRMTDTVIALPILPLLIVLAALDLGKLGLPEGLATSENASLWKIVVIVAMAGWTTTARLVRAATLSVRSRTYVEAAVASGASTFRILWRHVLPNVSGPILVAVTLSIGNVILLESVLSFLGLGIQPPTPSWGAMLTNAQTIVWEAPHLAIWPGLLVFVTVLAINLLGDSLRDRIVGV
ncbi:MAG: ABC transporter permease [Alphaproteobacteria bacterium]|nr:ABC transporter permease [Alphaproteobacteria bacterium]